MNGHHVATSISLVLAALMTGCVFVPAQVSPQYRVDPQRKSPLQAIKPVIIGLQVEDHRPPGELDRVGNRRSGYGAVAAPVKATKDVSLIIYDALRAELENNGHTVTNATSDPSERRINVAVKKYWTENQMNFFDITVSGIIFCEVLIRDSHSDQVLYSKAISATIQESRQLATESAYQDVLEKTMAEFVRNFSRNLGILSALQVDAAQSVGSTGATFWTRKEGTSTSPGSGSNPMARN